MLATYDHPTPQSLLIPAGLGGFGTGEDGRSYAQLAVWLGRLGSGLVLTILVQVLGAKGDVEACAANAVRGISAGPSWRSAGMRGNGKCGEFIAPAVNTFSPRSTGGCSACP